MFETSSGIAELISTPGTLAPYYAKCVRSGAYRGLSWRTMTKCTSPCLRKSLENRENEKERIRVLGIVNLVELANGLGQLMIVVIKNYHLVIDIDSINLGYAIVSSSYPVVIRDRLVFMDPELGDSSKGQ